MTTSTTEQEVTGPPPSFGEGWTPPEGAIWVPVAPAATPATAEPDEVDSPTRNEAPAGPQSHRKHIGAITAAGGIVGGVALWQAFGIMGLLTAGGAVAGLVAAPVAAYALYKRRGRNRTPMGRKPRGQGLVRRATSRLGSTGLSRGRGMPKLGGGRGGPKLGGKSGKLLGGGKSGGLLGGKGAKLGGGKSGLGAGGRGKGLLGSRGRGGKGLLGGGRGSGLGGKSRIGRKGGLGLASGRGAKTANRSPGLTGRASRGGLNLGRRSGKATRGALGRWSKSTGAGAGILGRKAATATRRRAATTAQRAANTRAGRRVAKAVQAAKQAHGQSAAKSPFARWRAATRAAHSQMPRYGRPYSNWATGVGAGVLALLTLLQLRLKAWKAKRNPQATTESGGSGKTGMPDGPASSSRSSTGSDPRWESTTIHGETFGRKSAPPPPKSPPPQPPPTIKVEVIRDEPMPPASLGAAPLAIGPGPIRKENMGFALLDAAEEFSAAAAKYAPPSAHDLAPEFDQLPKVIANLAAGLRHYARRIDEEEPVEAPVGEALFELFDGITQLIKTAEEIGPLHRQIHEKDIAREEAPRRNEGRWNTRR